MLQKIYFTKFLMTETAQNYNKNNNNKGKIDQSHSVT